ncbi:hypothetical protein ACFPIJ_00380 [Dactylosporangium cerinum]|uniref:Uncharacterized protein n=1 Tax=Dactylosporangium cerinum TaxID=1434730 RepID=A0ABV9VLS3_9ACTN
MVKTMNAVSDRLLSIVAPKAKAQAVCFAGGHGCNYCGAGAYQYWWRIYCEGQGVTTYYNPCGSC